MRKYILIPICCLILGCATVGTKITQDQISKLQKRVTTKSEVISLLGKPSSVVEMTDRTVFSYIHSVAKNTVGNFIPVYSMIHTEIKSDTDTLTITFTKKNIVEDYSYSQSTMPLTAGLIP